MKKALLGCASIIGAGLLAHRFVPEQAWSSPAPFFIGNSYEFSPARVPLNPNTPLYGKHVAFLGSSITQGAASRDASFVEYLQAGNGILPTKSAISGTTLAGTEPDTYVSRLESDFDADDSFDLFVVQLSTNDSRQNKELGSVSRAKTTSKFNKETTLGAIEFICSYVRSTFGCPVVFYTCLRKNDPDYVTLVGKLYDLQRKWGFSIIDLWADPALNALTDANPIAMMDDAHPTRAGYLRLWTPIFERELIKALK